MCGRYRLTAKERYIREHFDLEEDPSWAPRYNIAPTQPVAVIRQDIETSKRTLSLLRWGFTPLRAGSHQSGPPVINARSETVAQKPLFREALQARRCLVPADGFFEFKKVGKAKVPYCFEVNGGKLFAFAGIWERSRNSRGEAIEACCILTTAPNAMTSQIHDRMPAILDASAYGIWLDSSLTDPLQLTELLGPYPPAMMRAYPVSSRLNNSRNDDPDCARELSSPEINDTLSLF